jgi:hypothetical protein
MYGLPDDLDLTFLEGISLLQVCVGANEVILNFDRSVSITIESTFRIRTVSGQDDVYEDPRSASAALVGLISDSVARVSAETSGTLRLAFAGGGVLEIYDSSSQYESYQIRHGQQQYVV